MRERPVILRQPDIETEMAPAGELHRPFHHLADGDEGRDTVAVGEDLGLDAAAFHHRVHRDAMAADDIGQAHERADPLQAPVRHDPPAVANYAAALCNEFARRGRNPGG